MLLFLYNDQIRLHFNLYYFDQIINIQKKRTRETYQNYQQKLRDKNLLSLHTTVADHAASADGGGQSDPAALSQNKVRKSSMEWVLLCMFIAHIQNKAVNPQGPLLESTNLQKLNIICHKMAKYLLVSALHTY